MERKTHLRIVRVTPNEKRHLIIYQFSDGCELTICFVGNIRAPWQAPRFLYMHSLWLFEEGGITLLGGIVHDPAAAEPSDKCYFHSASDLIPSKLLRYLEVARHRVLRSWGCREQYDWLASETTLEAGRLILRRLASPGLAVLPEEMVATAVPRLI